MGELYFDNTALITFFLRINDFSRCTNCERGALLPDASTAELPASFGVAFTSGEKRRAASISIPIIIAFFIKKARELQASYPPSGDGRSIAEYYKYVKYMVYVNETGYVYIQLSIMGLIVI